MPHASAVTRPDGSGLIQLALDVAVKVRAHKIVI